MAVVMYHKKWQSERSFVISENLVHKIMLMFKKTYILRFNHNDDSQVSI